MSKSVSESVSQSVISQSEREKEEDDDIISIKLSWRSNSLERNVWQTNKKKTRTINTLRISSLLHSLYCVFL